MTVAGAPPTAALSPPPGLSSFITLLRGGRSPCQAPRGEDCKESAETRSAPVHPVLPVATSLPEPSATGRPAFDLHGSQAFLTFLLLLSSPEPLGWELAGFGRRQRVSPKWEREPGFPGRHHPAAALPFLSPPVPLP